ncbi:fibronectin-binding domain-containing protein [Halonotius terrestris]|uniref:Archaeal Rqc2 homolog aRqcH n=1 Tax=Halonotius terrestris TaxID=2487750 RepID=A0A8J8P9D7_9EURY|nr:ribosome rescue protein RqcH [Halonotius terrestris]TQQ82619.1 fibronectin-binding domain-containing protein [Halonotius terrestris]
MNAKRELSSIDLAALVTEMGRYEGAKVDKAYLYGDDLLRLKMRDFDRGRVELMLEVGEVKRAHMADPDHVADAPGRPPNFAKMLRNRLGGADFAGVSQYEFDRILVFEFERPDANTTLVVELFGEGNIAALDETGEVIQSLQTVRLKSRTIAPGSQYEYPDSRIDPLSVGFDAFVREMDDSTSDVVRTLATQLNLGGLYAEEVCTRAGVEKETQIEDATEDEYRAIYDALDELATRVDAGDFEPRIYLDDDRVVDVTPFPLAEREAAGLDEEHYDDFTAAVDDYFYRFDRSDDDSDSSDPNDGKPDFEAEIAKQQRIIDQQEGAIEGFEQQAAEERAKAEALYEQYDRVDEILTTIQNAREDGVPWDEINDTLQEAAESGLPAAEAVVEVDGSEGTVTIDIGGTRATLDATIGVEKNADQLYQEAKRIEEKKEGAKEAIEQTRKELEAVKARRDAWEADDGDDNEDGSSDEDEDTDDGDDEFADTDWLARSSIPIKRDEGWYERFRWFHTTDGFLVIGGRNADQNEALVKKYMSNGDRFFHAEAHGGPVTILKATGPSEPAKEVDFPEETLRQAAQFAVSHSSVWKAGQHAGDVYMVEPDQVSKTPESGEYIEKGSFVIRGDRTYFNDLAVDLAVGIQCEPQTRVVGGPTPAVADAAAAHLQLQPGKYAQNDMAKRCYRELKGRFADESFVRSVASPDLIQEHLPAGGSEIIE